MVCGFTPPPPKGGVGSRQLYAKYSPILIPRLLSSFYYMCWRGVWEWVHFISFEPSFTCLHPFFKAQNMRPLQTQLSMCMLENMTYWHRLGSMTYWHRLGGMTYWHRLGSIFTLFSLGETAVSICDIGDLKHLLKYMKFESILNRSQGSTKSYIPLRNKIFVEYFED